MRNIRARLTIMGHFQGESAVYTLNSAEFEIDIGSYSMVTEQIRASYSQNILKYANDTETDTSILKQILLIMVCRHLM